MENIYLPSVCGWAVKGYGVPICRLQTMPCALLRGEKCYMQESDEAVLVIGELFNKEEGEKES